MSKLTRLKYIVRTSIIVIMVCYFGLMAILSLPLIQNKISRIAARQLSELFHTEVSIGNVDLGLLNRIILQNVKYVQLICLSSLYSRNVVCGFDYVDIHIV